MYLKRSVLVESSLTIGIQPKPQIPFEQMSTPGKSRYRTLRLSFDIDLLDVKRQRLSGNALPSHVHQPIVEQRSEFEDHSSFYLERARKIFAAQFR
jgi:hypothetical protein